MNSFFSKKSLNRILGLDHLIISVNNAVRTKHNKNTVLNGSKIIFFGAFKLATKSVSEQLQAECSFTRHFHLNLTVKITSQPLKWLIKFITYEGDNSILQRAKWSSTVLIGASSIADCIYYDCSDNFRCFYYRNYKRRC